MGWTYELNCNEKLKGVDLDKKIESLCCCKFLTKGSLRGTTYYRVFEDDKGIPTMAVILLRQSNNEFGYKIMTEHDGPCQCKDVPVKMLQMIEKYPTSEWATEWRKRCHIWLDRKKKAKKLVNGAKIKFENPITFRSGNKIDTFYVGQMYGKNKKDLYYMLDDKQIWVNIKNWQELEFKIVE